MSPKAESLYEDTTSKYAAEGIQAHALAERCLRDRVYAAGCGAASEEMREAVQVYLDYVWSEQKRLGGSTLLIEHKFNLDHIYPGLFGTNDACILQPFGELVVIDYKHVQSKIVDPEENMQLMYYGLGALQHIGAVGCESVTLVIVQPRADHPEGVIRKWTTTPEFLINWGKTVLLPAAQECDSPRAKYVNGDHCQFCKAIHDCPAWQTTAVTVATVEENPIQTGREPMLPLPSQLSPEQFATAMRWSKGLADWCDKIWEHAKAMAEAGNPPPGYKLVAGRATRKWIDEHTVADVVGPEIAFVKELRSPAQVEKELKTRKIDIDISGMITETRGTTLVPVTDRRPAINAASPFVALL